MIKDDLSEAGRLRVTSSNPRVGHAGVHIVEWVNLATAEERTSFSEEGYRAEFRGLPDKWCVVREADGHTMHIGLVDIDRAREYIRGLHGQPGVTVRAV